MLYVEFLKWVGKQGLKSKVLQKYLNTAWQEATKGGKVILKTHFPKILNKAKEYYEGFKRAGLEVVKPIKVPEQTKNILNIKSTLKGRPVKVVPEPKKGIETILPKFLHAGKGKKGQKLFFDPKTGKTFEETVVGPAKKLTPKTTIKDLQIGPHIDKSGRLWPKFVKPIPKGPAEIIYGRFPKKPPGKAEGGIASFAEGELVLPRRKPEGLLLEEEKRKIDRNRRNIIKNQDAFDDKGAAILELLDEDEMFWRRNMKDWIERNEVLHEDAGIAGAGGLGDLLGEYSNGGEVKKKPFLEKIFGPTLKSQWDTFTEKQKQYIRENHPNSVPEGKAQGGRIGLAEGDTPSQAWMRDYFYKSGLDRSGVITLREYMDGGRGWRDYMDHGPGKAQGGRIGYGGGGTSIRKYTIPPEALPIVTKMYEKAGGRGQTGMSLKEFAFAYFNKKKGGRVGFQDGEGVMSRTGNVVDVGNIPYYAGKGLQGLVHSAETLSKLPLAAGELGSKLIRQKPSKEMFSEAIENITPGSWSENLGLTSLIEGMEKERSPEAITAGGILGLGTEIAVPTGGAFKAGQLLLNKASKAMGKVKDGKNLNKLIDEKLTDFGQSRRDFNVMASTSGLMVALKSIGLGGLFKAATKVKPSDDVIMRLRTFIDDSDVDTEWGPQATAKFGGFFDVEGLTIAAQKTLDKIMKELNRARSGSDDLENPWKRNSESDLYEEIDLDWGTYILDGLKKAGHKVEFEHVDDVGGRGVDEILDSYKNDSLWKGTAEGRKNYKEFSEKTKNWSPRKKAEYHSSITDDYGSHYSAEVEEFFDDFYGVVKKASGGRIGLEGGGPAYEDFEEFMEEMKGMNKQQSREEFLKSWEKYKKWKYGDELSGGYLRREEVAEGGHLTRTIPPERGPVPQGLSYLLYDDTMRSGSR